MEIMLSNPPRMANEILGEILTPPPPVDLEQWAVDNIEFSERESPFPGPYNKDQFSMFSEILKALGPDDPCRTVTLIKSAQIGGTVLGNIFTLGSLHLDPCDFLFVHPTEDNGKRWSRMKLAPMLKNTTALRALFPGKTRDASDSLMYKERLDGRGAIQISGANSPSSLSQVSMRRQVQDDLAKWDTNAAGDPEKQADSRSRAFEFAKIFKASTPLIAPGCRITRNFDAGSQEHLEVPCPECGHYHALEWENLLANLDDEFPDKVFFSCPECGAVIEEHHRDAMRRQGNWVAKNPKARSKHRSFYLWSAYSSLQSWQRIADEWRDAEGDPAAEQVFLNDTVGKAYRTKGEAPPWETLRDRAEETGHVRGTIPAGAVLLTVGVDCQKDRVEWHLVGWGRDLRRWVIDYGVISEHIAEKGCQEGLADLLKSSWRNVVGRSIEIDLMAIDGNAWTEDVWSFAKKHRATDVIMVRGANSDNAPLFAQVKKERNKAGKLLKYSRRFYNFGSSVMKMAFYRNLKKVDPLVRGYVGLPKGMEDEYYRQITAERRVPSKNKNGYTTYKWDKDANQANEGLDTMLQAESAAMKLGVRSMPDSVWSRYEEREKPLEEEQMDLEDILLAPATPETVKIKTPAQKAAASSDEKDKGRDRKTSKKRRPKRARAKTSW